MDFNIYETSSRTLERIGEAQSDFAATFKANLETPLELMGKQDLSKYRHSQSILDDAYRALAHGNREEAGYQLKRELFFSEKNMVPGNRYEKAAHAGLAALKQDGPIEEIEWKIDSAFIGIGDSNFDSDSEQILLNPSHSWNWSQNVETAAKYYCIDYLGSAVPRYIDWGWKEPVRTCLRRSIYLSDKYILDERGEPDRYEKAARQALNLLDRGELGARIKDILKPFMQEREVATSY
ncbi:MAG: hypothetical protein R3D26_18525 [Cyanobacteriota/Melainabacteria group bacterium]